MLISLQYSEYTLPRIRAGSIYWENSPLIRTSCPHGLIMYWGVSYCYIRHCGIGIIGIGCNNNTYFPNNDKSSSSLLVSTYNCSIHLSINNSSFTFYSTHLILCFGCCTHLILFISFYAL